MGMELDVQPLLLGPTEGETTTDRPERTIRILCDFDQVIVSWFRYEPGEEGPEPHVHREHSDAFYVLGGEVDFGLGPEVTRITGGPGTFVAAPPNVVHTFKNSSDATATFLNIHAPSKGFGDVLRGHGREDFDQFDPPDDGGRPFEDSIFKMTFAPEFEGVDPHTHDGLVDAFLVLEGEVDFVVGDEVRRADAGVFLAAPPGARHGFSNPGPDPLRVLNIHAPDGGFAGRLRS